MDEEARALIQWVRALYGPILAGRNARIRWGNLLMNQFEEAVARCENQGRRAWRGVSERINEMSVDKVLADDQHLTGDQNGLPFG